MVKETLSNSCNDPLRDPRCFWQCSLTAMTRSILPEETQSKRGKVCYMHNKVQKRLCEKQKEERKVFLYVNIPLLGQKSQVSFLCLGEKRIFRQAERRGSVNRSILGGGLKGHL